MTLAEDVLRGLGPAFRRRAGELLEDLVDLLTAPGETSHQLMLPTGRRGWAAMFDVATTPLPAWLAHTTGTDLPSGLSTEAQRTYLDGQPGWRRGSVAAMKAAVRTVLTGAPGTHRVDILERVGGDPYRFGIRVWRSELPVGMSTTEAEPLIVAAALTQKPIGLLADVDVEFVDSVATYAHFTAAHGSYAAFDAAFPTLDSVITHVPEEGTPD